MISLRGLRASLFSALPVVLLAATSASAQTITAITPSTIGAGSHPTMTFTGAVPSPTTLVAFAVPGQCAFFRVGQTLLDSSDTAPLGTAISGAGVYRVCYSVNNGAIWTEQAAPILTVVAATATSISSITPSTIGTGTQPTMTFTGAVATPTTMVAFAPSGQCSSPAMVGLTPLDTSDIAPLGEAISAAGEYRLCYSVDGVTWTQQTTPILTVIAVGPDSISSISPSTIGAGSQPTMTFTGAVPTPTTRIAFAPVGQCSTPASRVGQTSLDSSDTAPLGTAISSAGVYKLCYSVDNGAVWTQQTAPSLTVVAATAGSISSINPSTIGAGSQPTMTFTGAAPTPTTVVAFAPMGLCGTAATVGLTSLDSSDTAPLGTAISSANIYKVCYSVDNGATWVQQTAPSLIVVSAAPGSISSISPSTIKVGTQPTMTFTGAVATPTTQIAFALSGQCSTLRVGQTSLDISDTAPLGTAISGAATYKVCYTVNGGATWMEQTAPSLIVYDHCAAGQYDTGIGCVTCGNGGSTYGCPVNEYQTGSACDGTGMADTQTCAVCTVCAAGEYESSACAGASDRSCAACDATCATCSGPFATDCTSCPGGEPVDPSGYCILPGDCAPVPAACDTAAKGSLSLSFDADPSRRSIKWKWSNGFTGIAQAGFGDPVAGTTGYTLCVYGDTGGSPLIASAAVPAGGTCGTKPCWKEVSTKGWSYSSKDGASSDGIKKTKLLGGDADKPKVSSSGKGALLLLSPPLSGTQSVDPGTPVIVQLHGDDPVACWSSTFDAASFTKNDGETLKAKFP